MSATFEALGITLGAGTAVMITSVGLFGFAIKKRATQIAPRCVARPRNVIYNPNPEDPSQERGSAWFGWIPWTLSLSYEKMLKGVPGTGTREGGLKGMMLKVNLDGIVLLQFHSFCRHVTMMGAFLFIVILLPIYFTARCPGGEIDGDTQCANYNLTDYMRTTIMNVPDATDSQWDEGQRHAFVSRLYATSFVFLFFVLYILHLLEKSWVTLLAMRRVFYLEHDVWEERRTELENTLLYDDTYADDNDDNYCDTSPMHSFRKQQHSREPPESHLVNRPAWIPHPEQRETVPNISLYSVLVGGLPSIPDDLLCDVDNSDTHEDGTTSDVDASKRINIDWQLEMAAQIFDLCVPNQPGFSSSVAAVTIIPGAQDMSVAWRKWYASTSKMRRLRYIRKQIEKLREYQIDFESDHDDNDEENPNSKEKDGEINEEEYHSTSEFHEGEPCAAGPVKVQEQEGQVDDSEKDEQENGRPFPSIYRGLSKRKSYYRQVFGPPVEEEHEAEVAVAVALGPEQAAVYSRELAQSASACCPFGCRDDRIRNARIDDLIEMEIEAAEELHAANQSLNQIRRRITVTTEGEDIAKRTAHGTVKRTVDFDEHRVPDDLGLEAQIYKRKNSKQGTEAKQEWDDNDRNRRASMNRSSGFRATLKPRQSTSNLWQYVEVIVSDANNVNNNDRSRANSMFSNESKTVETGEWRMPTFSDLKHCIRHLFSGLTTSLKNRSTSAVDALARSSTFAVVTFTSRQAAVAARMCLADGRGHGRWQTVKEIPIPPLADAAPCDLMACRNCCRPVTISLNDRQKRLRKYLAIGILACIYVFYTVPLTFVANLAKPAHISQVFPSLGSWIESLGIDISGLVSAMLYSLFFSFCPFMFKSIANFGSDAHSVADAELRALQYYWWFMLLTAFSSTLLASMVINGFNSGSFGDEFRTVLVSISRTIPETIAVTWLNWIIYRFTATLPLYYMLQFNSFVFSALGWKCCARLMAGGGPGGPTYLRVYVDSGVVLLCVVALAPASPLVALGGFGYFLVIEPILRRNLVFVFRPSFDAGGARWIFCCDMTYSAIIVGVILLTTMLVLKGAIGPAIIAGLTLVPTLVHQSHTQRTYKPAYDDASLLQTALLDGWDTSPDTLSRERREEFRQWLVDAHKAAYIPVCMFGLDTIGCLTAEPAVTLPLVTDPKPRDEFKNKGSESPHADTSRSPESLTRTSQVGATFRRSSSVFFDAKTVNFNSLSEER